ncbi:MAG: acyltransferase family protein [Pirellulales bacterium]
MDSNNTTNNLTSADSTNRLHGFDAIRASAILLVILLHASVPYLINSMPGLLWPTNDVPSQSDLIDGLFWWIECFIMAMYFVIAGYFAMQLYRSRGTHGFLVNRCKRLFMPLVAASVTILPITGFIFTLGWVLDGKYPAIKLRSFRFEESVENDFFGFSHLWFLQYLVVYCFAFWAISRLLSMRKNNPDKQSMPTNNSWQWVWSLLISLPVCALVLSFDSRVVLGFQQSLLPVVTRLIYYAMFFGSGIWLFQNRGWVSVVQRYHLVLLAGSGLVFAGLLPRVQAQIQSEMLSTNWTVAFGVVIFAWLTTLGLFGLFLKRFPQPIAIFRYCSDASFWMYLIHLPIVAGVHILLSRTDLNVGLKLVVAVISTVGLSLFTYQFGVRHTRLGRWLEGSHSKKGTVSENQLSRTAKDQQLVSAVQ